VTLNAALKKGDKKGDIETIFLICIKSHIYLGSITIFLEMYEQFFYSIIFGFKRATIALKVHLQRLEAI
jgi:hypothetical protein